MNPAATTERELAESSEGKALLLDSFGVSKESVHVISRLTDTGEATARPLELGEPAQEPCQVASEDVWESSTAPISSRKRGFWPRNEIEILAIKARVVVAGVDTFLKYAEAVGLTAADEPTRVEERIDRIFRTAVDEDFEDGMSSRFSRELLEAVEQFGDPAMQEISYLILYNRMNQEVASEALRWLGRLSDRRTYGWRLWLLEKSLSSSSPVVRDGAVLGLASMGDPSSMTYLSGAIAEEECKELREDMQQALRELEAASSAAIAQKNQEV